MDATELGRWTRFAAKGGIGKCTAVQDCVAEEPDDLMFLKDDEIIVLMHLLDQEDVFLGYCEGVVGRFSGANVRFHGRLKKPVMTKRSSTYRSASVGSSRSRPSSSQSAMTLAAREASPQIPLHNSPAPTRTSSPTRMSYSYSNSSSVVSETSSISAHAEPSTSGYNIPASLADLEKERYSMLAPFGALVTTVDSPVEPEEIDGDAYTPGSPLGHNGVSALNLRQNDYSPLSPPAVSPLNIRKLSPKPVLRALPDEDVHTASQESFSFDTEESSRISRISIETSDGVTGIGLSLLQGFMGAADGDDSASVASSRSSVRLSEQEESRYDDSSRPGSSESTVEGPPAASIDAEFRPNSEYSQYSSSPQSTREQFDDLPPPLPAYAREPSIMSRSSMHSEYSGNSEWEGDIYDQYRYSRFSVASKMSRLSQGSLRPMGTGPDVPPIPSDIQAALASQSAKRGGSSPLDDVEENTLNSSPTDAGSAARGAEETTDDMSERIMKGRPSPLELIGGRASSPLLHAAFGSPQSTTTPLSMDSFLSPSIRSPRSPNESSPLPNGASSASFGAQQDQTLQPASPIIRPGRASFVRVNSTERLSGQNIVVEDDESLPSPFDTPSPSTPQQPVPPPQERVPPPYALTPGRGSPAPPPSSLLAGPMGAVPRPAPPGGRPADPVPRQSLFMPHPHAPKPANTPTGPMYGRQPVGPGQPMPPSGPPPGSAFQILRMALAYSQARLTTIYARFDYDLASSAGPVPISFSLDPPMDIPANRPASVRPQIPSSRSASPAIVPERHMVSSPLAQSARPTEGREVPNTLQPSQPIHRANFVPSAPGQRPRSRSFSGFDSRPTPAQSDVGDDSVVIAPSLSVVTKRSKSASATPVASPIELPTPQRATVSHTSTAVRTVQKPSPLSFSQNNIVASSPSPPASSHVPRRELVASPSPISPVAETPIACEPSFDRSSAKSPPMRNVHLGGQDPVRQQSRGTLSSETSRSSPPSSPRSPSGPFPVLRHSRSSLSTSSKSSAANTLTRPRVSSQGRPSQDHRPRRPSDLQSNTATPSPDPSESSSSFLRTASRSSTSTHRAHDRSLLQPDGSPESSVVSFDHAQDHKTVSIKDMDFELVNPTVLHSPLAASSVESLPLPPRRADVMSNASINGSATSFKQQIQEKRPTDIASVEIQETTDMDAHRQRELRWISTMSSVPPSQSRKSKKIRKLVLEGVPASVRYLVWAHLTDSKAKRMDGLYGRLGQRERVAQIADIEHDSQKKFHDQPLQHQCLVNVLQAYLSMVPDIQYTRGLAVVASQLLMQSPEEDAFWTFVSLMDSHLRPYFSRSNVQLDVDASLFLKALEINDPAVSKRIFVDMAIQPMAICRPWFCYVFTDSFTSDYLLRIWDVFLFEGVTVLFRVGLAIVSCCRQLLLQSKDQDALLKILAHPPLMCLPSNPDTFLELVFSVKLKDEDLRKQRAKLEAQFKRQTQPRPSLSSIGSRGPTPPISLPKSGP